MSTLDPVHDPDGAAGPLSGPQVAAIPSRPPALLVPLTALLFFVWIMMRNGWLSEDAFISLRVVDNFVHGYGLRWNVLDRVQVFTHPLWLLLMSAFYAVLRSIYFAAILPSFLCSALCVWLLLSRGARGLPQALLCTVLVTFSKAFVDFSSSGLENPLSHLLLVLFFLEYLGAEAPWFSSTSVAAPAADPRAQWRRMCWSCGLLLTNRMDLVWLIAPAMAHELLRRRPWRAKELVADSQGLGVFVAWEIFSVVYYGFPFPNTAYVKLFTGIPPLHLAAQGCYYLVNSMAWDPMTLFAIACAITLALVQRRGDRRTALVCLGIGLELLYVIKIGGDYMSGRFLTAPFAVAVVLAGRLELPGLVEPAVLTGVLLAFGVWSQHPPITADEEYKGSRTNIQWVDDEHGLRAADTGFLRLNKNGGIEDTANPWIHDAMEARAKRLAVIVYPNIGYFGYFAGPGVHVIDPYGIGDALVARLPCDRTPIGKGTEGGQCHVASVNHWASGHYLRNIPDGYADTAIGLGTLKDPALQAYFERLSLVTRGPLLSASRWAEIASLNLGLDAPPR